MSFAWFTASDGYAKNLLVARIVDTAELQDIANVAPRLYLP